MRSPQPIAPIVRKVAFRVAAIIALFAPISYAATWWVNGVCSATHLTAAQQFAAAAAGGYGLGMIVGAPAVFISCLLWWLGDPNDKSRTSDMGPL